jgi:hypothetical protein
MGLDAFKSGSTSTSNKSSTSSSSKSGKSSGPYKTFRASDARKKVIKTEEEWNEVVNFIETNFGISEDEVMEMDADTRHEVLHKAILGNSDADTGDFYPTRECFVCDEVFSFPTSWSFCKYEGQAVCKDHTIEEVQDAHEEMNELHG